MIESRPLGVRGICMRDLKDIREELDVIDSQILELYERRLGLAEDVAIYKEATHKPIYDKKREEEKLAALGSMASDDFARQGILELFEQIMSTSRKKQYRYMASKGLVDRHDFTCMDAFDFHDTRVVYQGVEGAYSQVAMQTFFPQVSDSFHVETWREAMETIKCDKADYAVLPIENSSAGSVSENYDLLMEYDVSIIGEQIIKIDHALLGVKGSSISDITAVYSHPQALMQCASYLKREHPDFETISMKNTAMAACKVKEDGDVHQAAIAGVRNAALYDLEILDESIQDNKENETRFIIVSRDKKYLSTADKISICFELPNEKGSLYHTLSHFIFNGLNMSKIESRPLPGRKWEYRFFIDFAGNLQEEAVLNALQGLKEETNGLRILGNYRSFSE